MAPEGRKKRSEPPLKSSLPPKKRQRVEASKGHSAKPRKRQVAVDSLPWNEVEMPDMFDDAEGFFGLEEVDGVEVVQEEGRIKFITTAAVLEEAEEEVFEGFGDDSPMDDKVTATSPREEQQSVVSQADKKTKSTKSTKKEKKQQPKEKDTKKITKPEPQTTASGETTENIFEVLLDNTSENTGIDVSAWADLDLSQEVLSALSKLRFAKPTLIQTEAIPHILAGHDVVGKGSTGSGKTLAFGIPIVESWLEKYGQLDEDEVKASRPPTALILSPTRELAHQLTEHITALCKGLTVSPHVAAVTGGLSVQKQQRQLAKADIIIGTPGRLWEVISTGIEISKALKGVKFLVVDEADRLLTEGHFKEAQEILGAIDRQEDPEEVNIPPRQTLVFSATFHKGLQQKLAGKGKFGLKDDSESMEYLLQKLNFREDKPKFVDVNPVSQMAEHLKEGMIECAGTEKDLYLYSLLLHHPGQRTLIFTNSIHAVRRVVPLLQNLGLPAIALHSQMIQKARLRSIERFSSAKSASILVATDVAARGLDIGGVQLVIHYHLPRTADMYVHRSGRTARAGSKGSSILICAPEEVVGTRRLVAKVHAHNAASAAAAKQSSFFIRSLDLDRKVVSRLKPRVTLAKKIADSMLAKEKTRSEDDWMRNAAEELGVEYDSDEFNAQSAGKNGRGAGRKIKEREASSLTKAELASLKAELRDLLQQRVNVGVSERYITGGRVDVNELLKGQKGEFLGAVSGIGLDDE